MPDFQTHHADEERGCRSGFVTGFENGGTVHVALEEGDEVGSRLGHDEVVDVEEFRHALEG
jgi:hypothetical protein